MGWRSPLISGCAERKKSHPHIQCRKEQFSNTSNEENRKADTDSYDYQLDTANKNMDISEQITCDANNLINAAQKAIKSSPKKNMTQQFALHKLDEIKRAQEELHERKWKIEQLKPFILHERGHVRKIRGNTPYDRMIMHSYIDNCLFPILSKYMIYDNYSSQKGKGTGLARDRMRYFLHSAYRKYGNNRFYGLLIDFSKYYDNIQHQKLFDYIMQYLPHEKFHEYMLWTILDSFKVDVSYMSDEEYDACLDELYVSLDHIHDEAKGLKYMNKSINIGNPAAQLFSIFYPTPIDNYCKIVEGIQWYGRYQDDTAMFHEDNDYLKYILWNITEKCKEQGIFVNTKKTKIVRVDHTFMWLHHKYRLGETGHLFENLANESVTREKQKLRKQQQMLYDGSITYPKIQESFKSWMGSNYKFLTKKQIETVCCIYNELFIEDWIGGGYIW